MNQRGEGYILLSPFLIHTMNKGAKVIASAIIGSDFKTIMVNGKAYTIYPPTINNLAGAIENLSGIQEATTLREVLLTLKDTIAYAKALSWFINGDDSMTDELSNGTYEECVNGVEQAISMIDITVFQKAVNLARNVSKMAATPK